MDVTNLGTVQPVPTSPNRPQGATTGAPRAADGAVPSTADSTQLAAPAAVENTGEQPDPSTPRGSLLDISV